MDLLFILYDLLGYILKKQALKRTQMLVNDTNTCILKITLFSVPLKDRTQRKILLYVAIIYSMSKMIITV